MSRARSKLRLVCVSHYFESHAGGIEIAAGALVRSLREAGIDVIWASSDASPVPDDLPSLRLVSSNAIEKVCGLPFPLPGPISLARLCKAIRASDAVLVHDGMYPTSMFSVVSGRLLRRPVVLVQHIGRVPTSSWMLRGLFGIADRMLTRSMLRLASQVVYISATSARHFADVRTALEPMLIFNGVDTSVFRPSPTKTERAHERKQLEWPAEQPVMLFVGRFLEKKGLIRLREMSRLRPDLHWAFAGWGPCNPEDWQLSNVTVHRGLSGAKLASLYRAADLLILPSKSEGFPLVVQEALACGLRPVCCDDAAEADPVASAEITSVSNAGSEADIVSAYLEAIDQLVGDAQSQERRQNRAQFARKRYSWAGAAKQYVAVLRSLTTVSPAPAVRKKARA